MTIIRPHATGNLKLFFIGFFSLILLIGGFYIFEYNAVANLRFQVRDLKGTLETASAENSDLKHAMYDQNDPQKLQILAQNRGFLLERKPHYVRINQWLSDSSL